MQVSAMHADSKVTRNGKPSGGRDVKFYNLRMHLRKLSVSPTAGTKLPADQTKRTSLMKKLSSDQYVINSTLIQESIGCFFI